MTPLIDFESFKFSMIHSFPFSANKMAHPQRKLAIQLSQKWN